MEEMKLKMVLRWAKEYQEYRQARGLDDYNTISGLCKWLVRHKHYGYNICDRYITEVVKAGGELW